LKDAGQQLLTVLRAKAGRIGLILAVLPIGGGEARHGSCCRLYLDDGGRRLVGVPSEAALRTAVARAARTSRTGAT